MTTELLSTTNLPRKKRIFSDKDLTLIDLSRVPEHLAIIMDGNRRWAKNRSLPPIVGHWEGAEVLTQIVQAASELGIKTLTVYAFSTENWIRPKEEVDSLLHLFKVYLLRHRKMMQREGVRFNFIGDIKEFSLPIRELLCQTKKATLDCNKIDLVLALNYGGRNEICRAISRLLDDYDNKKINKTSITESLFSHYLDTANWKDPDLLLRTSGEWRLSNFLLWQMSYCELVISDVLWPDFTEKDLLDAILVYQRRERRLGGSK